MPPVLAMPSHSPVPERLVCPHFRTISFANVPFTGKAPSLDEQRLLGLKSSTRTEIHGTGHNMHRTSDTLRAIQVQRDVYQTKS